MKQTTEPILDLKEVCFRYSDGSVGLDNCSLRIPRGSRTALLGANGAGKTTLFLHLNGILRPQRGEVSFCGTPLDYGRRNLRTLRSRVGLVFQDPDRQLFSANVREDVSFGPLNLGLDSGALRSRVAEALLAVGMQDCADKPVHNLSFGQKKRVCLAGVLAMRPEVLVLDEPMAGLDPAMQADLSAILDRLHAEGMTIVIASHDLDFAYQWADTVSVMAQGKCAATWEARRLPEVLQQLAGFGLGVPRVAEIYQKLVAGGFPVKGGPPPRSHQDLLDLLVPGKMAAQAGKEGAGAP